MEIYIVRENETKEKEIILVTTNRGKALDYLNERGYSVSGHQVEE